MAKSRDDPKQPGPKEEPERATLGSFLKSEDGHRGVNDSELWKQNNARSMEVLGAYLRMGARELGTALSHHGDSTVHGEYGTLATKPPSMVADGLRGRGSIHGKDDVDMNVEHAQPDPEIELEPEIDPEMEMDME